MRATDPSMEEGLEALKEGEEARFAVNALVGDGQHGDAGPRRAGIRLGDRSCRWGERFEGQQLHGGKACFATGGNAVNPRIGSDLKMVAGSRRIKPSRW
jgi:hypothetical protein